MLLLTPLPFSPSDARTVTVQPNPGTGDQAASKQYIRLFKVEVGRVCLPAPPSAVDGLKGVLVGRSCINGFFKMKRDVRSKS
ncbi:hypothetical protein QR685DRAFT_539448 [Neurospora intermedia]|uniref:Uncharacterized protein n=1 Tax=Neurospora intermedia TaxID=5142 RepID=A0ABR3CXH3_NEUIN